MNNWRLLIPVLAVIGAVVAFSERTFIDARQECVDRQERHSSVSRPGSNCFQRLASDQTRRVKEREKTQRSRIDYLPDFLGQHNVREESSRIRRVDARVVSADRAFSRSYHQQIREQTRRETQEKTQKFYGLSSGRQLKFRDELQFRNSEDSASDGYRRLRLYRDFRRIEQSRKRSRDDNRTESRIRSVSELSVRLGASRLLREEVRLSGKIISEQSLSTSFGNHDTRHFERNPAHKLSLPKQFDSQRTGRFPETRFINTRDGKSYTKTDLRSRNARSTERHTKRSKRNQENQQQKIIRSDLDIETGNRHRNNEQDNNMSRPLITTISSKEKKNIFRLLRESSTDVRQYQNNAKRTAVRPDLQHRRMESQNSEYQMQRTLPTDTNVEILDHTRGDSTARRDHNRRLENLKRRIVTRSRKPEYRIYFSASRIDHGRSKAENGFRSLHTVAMQQHQTKGKRSLRESEINKNCANGVNTRIISSKMIGNENTEIKRDWRHESEPIAKLSDRIGIVRQSHENIGENSERFGKVNGRDSVKTNFRYRRETSQAQIYESNHVLNTRIRRHNMENYFENNLLTISEWKTLVFYYLQGIYMCAILYNFIGGFEKTAKTRKFTFDVRRTHPGKTIKVD